MCSSSEISTQEARENLFLHEKPLKSFRLLQFNFNFAKASSCVVMLKILFSGAQKRFVRAFSSTFSRINVRSIDFPTEPLFSKLFRKCLSQNSSKEEALQSSLEQTINEDYEKSLQEKLEKIDFP